MTTLTTRAAEGLEGVWTRDAGRAKNLFALGLLSWLYGRPTDVTERWIETKFASRPASRAANLAAFRAGWSFGETTELLDVQYRVAPATDVAPGTYRQVNGTTATALGLIAASVRSRPAAAARELPDHARLRAAARARAHDGAGVRTIQAEDEIAAAGMALGAAFGGHLGVTATSGPGMDLKAETIGLAAMLELPLVVVDVQRAGPSTGMPTKTEQSDLLKALHGRHGESPLPVLAAATPGDCFETAFEAARLAIDYRTPVILLSDGFLSNSSSRGGSRTRPRCRRSIRRSRSARRGSRSCPTRATSAACGRGRRPARRASRTASAGSRSRTAPATSPTTRPTTRR